MNKDEMLLQISGLYDQITSLKARNQSLEEQFEILNDKIQRLIQGNKSKQKTIDSLQEENQILRRRIQLNTVKKEIQEIRKK